MDLGFWLIQLIGIIAWLFLIASYYREDTNKILVFQIIATALYCLHYYLLDASSGLFICVFETLRDYLYYRTDIDDYLFYGSIPVYIVYGYFGYSKLFDLLPVCSSLIDGYSLTKKRDKVVIWAIISYTSWVIYDLCVKSYSCALTDGMIVISNLSILIRERMNKDIGKRKVITKKTVNKYNGRKKQI